MAPKQKQEPGRGIWIGNGKGAHTQQMQPEHPSLPWPHTSRQELAPPPNLDAIYGPLSIRTCHVRAGLSKGPSEAGCLSVGLYSIIQADLSHGEMDGPRLSTHMSAYLTVMLPAPPRCFPVGSHTEFSLPHLSPLCLCHHPAHLLRNANSLVLAISFGIFH